MMRRFVALAATSVILALPAVAEPLPTLATPPSLLPVGGRCQLTIGTAIPSSLGPVRVTLSINTRGSDIRIERDGIAGAGEGSGQARLTAGKSGIFNFSHQLGAGRYMFNAGSDGTALTELLAGSPKLTIAPLTTRENQKFGDVPLFQGSAPHLTIDIGDVAPQAAQMAQCGEWLAIANKAYFCARLTAFQTNQGCSVSAWRMAARDDQEIDWVDVNRVTRDGSVIQFVMLSQHGTIAAIKQSADRMAAIRIVQGDCSSHDYHSKMFATYGSDDKVVAMTVEQPASAADLVVVQDLEIACGGRWQSPVTADPFGDTADRFEQERVHREEHNFDRY